MLIDLHLHSSAISRCCKISLEDGLTLAKAMGMDGVALTNHYVKNYVADENYLAFARQYMDECEKAITLGKAQKMPVFWGIELTPEYNPKVHLLIYGVGEDFLLRYPTLFDWDLPTVYQRVKEAGGILVQAHPFRYGEHLQDLRFLDGVEVNCHPGYADTYLERVYRIADENGLILTCGGDFHKDTYRPVCGMYLPEEISDSKALAEYLKTASELALCVQEAGQEDLKKVMLKR
ncbi:MAG: hypothetical protein IJN42_02555 [Clostridia bacterium]|nr:hypothetical protein [Clostridia bacterium]